jgi:PAS domain S-box-containing protein
MGERGEGRRAKTGGPKAVGGATALRELIENAPDGVFIADLEGRYTDANAAGCRIYGCPRERIVGRTIMDFIAPEDVGRLFAIRNGLLDSGGDNVAEWDVRRQDGTTVPVEVSDTILSDGRWVGFVRDISRRRELERDVRMGAEQLRAERNFVDAILDTAATLIVVFDGEARVVRFNKACEAVSGFTQAERLGRTIWDDLIPPDEREGVTRVAQRLREGEPFVEYVNHWQHRDGSRRLIRWRNTLIADEAGRVLFFIGTGTDITDQARAEAQARLHLEEASRLQRLHTVSELATTLAHELNQPLAAIATFAGAGQQLLARPHPELSKLAATLDRISEQALRAGAAIRHLRAFVGRGKVDPGPIDLNAVVHDACGLLAPQARGCGVSLGLDLDESLPPVLGVGVHVEQVLLNLLANALEAIQGTDASGGAITVSTRRMDDAAQVTVRDSGPGIDGATAARLFEPFFTSKEHGLGIGLPICRSLLEAQGGRLWPEVHVPGGILHFTLSLAP